jgi:LacI family transcriptional regulator
MSERRSTINDVAALAGVSIKTVSRVLNNEPNVRPRTRKKVTDAVRELNYRPNVSARRLAANRSFVIGLMYDLPHSDYISEFQDGVLKVCHEAGYHMLVHPCDTDNAQLAGEVVDLFRQVTVDGFIVLQPISDDNRLNKTLVDEKVPYVRVSQRRFKGPPLVSVDDTQSAANMTRYLIGLGHRRIGFIVGRPDQGSSHDRLAGYTAALRDAQIEFDSTLVEQGLYSFESGYSCARRLLALDPRPTAIFASNDHMAMGVLTVAHEKRLDVPKDLSVAGFDDTAMARFAWPPLTTVRQPVTQVARLAAETLVKCLQGDAAREREFVLHSDLMKRASTGPNRSN